MSNLTCLWPHPPPPTRHRRVHPSPETRNKRRSTTQWTLRPDGFPTTRGTDTEVFGPPTTSDDVWTKLSNSFPAPPHTHRTSPVDPSVVHYLRARTNAPRRPPDPPSTTHQASPRLDPYDPYYPFRDPESRVVVLIERPSRQDETVLDGTLHHWRVSDLHTFVERFQCVIHPSSGSDDRTVVGQCWRTVTLLDSLSLLGVRDVGSGTRDRNRLDRCLREGSTGTLRRRPSDGLSGVLPPKPPDARSPQGSQVDS